MGVGIRLVEGWKQAIYNSSKLFNIWEGDVRGKLLSRVNVEARSAFTLFFTKSANKTRGDKRSLRACRDSNGILPLLPSESALHKGL